MGVDILEIIFSDRAQLNCKLALKRIVALAFSTRVML